VIFCVQGWLAVNGNLDLIEEKRKDDFHCCCLGMSLRDWRDLMLEGEHGGLLKRVMRGKEGDCNHFG